jgi:hypothetical protein
MFHNLNCDLNTKYKFTYELSVRGVDESPGVVGGGNGDNVSYGE